MQPMPPMPPKQPMPQPQGGQPPMPPAGGGAAPGAPPGGMPKVQGPRPVSNTGFNSNVQALLFTRIQALNPQEIQTLDQIMTPQTLPILGKIFPELIPLFNESTAGKPTVRSPVSPGGAPAGAPGGQPPPQGASPAPPGSDNPLSNPPPSGGPSKGLMGG